MDQSADPWVRHLELPSGAAVLVRPLTAHDDALIRDSRDDLRLRFFGSIKAFSNVRKAPCAIRLLDGYQLSKGFACPVEK